jgi:hypothetical protein
LWAKVTQRIASAFLSSLKSGKKTTHFPRTLRHSYLDGLGPNSNARWRRFELMQQALGQLQVEHELILRPKEATD